MFFYMPVKVVDGCDCVRNNALLMKGIGKKALLVTGKNSARVCGALDDVIYALGQCGIEYEIFDKIMANPTIEVIYEGAEAVKKCGADFIIGIGGGSPMDAAKAIALLFENEGISPKDFLDKKYEDRALPLVLVPTTCGTGSEVTPYAVITNDFMRSKSSVSGDSTYCKLAFVDSKYLKAMKYETLLNTAFDAFSHSAEGYVSVKANYVSDKLALDGIRIFGRCMSKLKNKELDGELYDDLMRASVLGGMVIAHTGTTAVHSLGYSFTYFKNIDHGRANAILYPEFLRLVSATMPERAIDIMLALNLPTVDLVRDSFEELLGDIEKLTDEEVGLFVEIGSKARSLSNSKACPDASEIERIYRASTHSY